MTNETRMPNDATIAARSLDHLQQVVAIDSASDESSETIPSTPGQARLADYLERFFEGLGACVELDENANVIASFAGRGAGAACEPLARMVHLDTARGTHAVDTLHVVQGWQGDRVPYPSNDELQVTTGNYPTLARYVGQDVVHGTGVDPLLDRGIAVANLGTGYFASESEKELTTLQTMAGHARWLVEFVRIAAAD